jgi:hypothetical protein
MSRKLIFAVAGSIAIACRASSSRCASAALFVRV